VELLISALLVELEVVAVVTVVVAVLVLIGFLFSLTEVLGLGVGCSPEFPSDPLEFIVTRGLTLVIDFSRLLSELFSPRI